MSVSSHSVNPEDDKEVHDLVLLFQNSRIPRGSDAFQTIMGDFLPSDEEDEMRDEVDGFDEVDAGPKAVMQEVHVNTDNKSDSASAVKTVRSRSLARVHFPDDEEAAQIIPKRRHSELPKHHPRIFVKTTPAKPILKHDDIDLGPARPRLQTT